MVSVPRSDERTPVWLQLDSLEETVRGSCKDAMNMMSWEDWTVPPDLRLGLALFE